MAGDDEKTTLLALETLISGLPLRHGWRLSLWTNFLNDPTYAQVEQVFGLLRDDVNILYCLAFCGRLTATTICKLTGRPKNSVSRAVERLRQRGLITRTIDAEDRRRSLLAIRDRGREVFSHVLPLFVERERRMLSSLDETDMAALEKILSKLMNAMPDWSIEF